MLSMPSKPWKKIKVRHLSGSRYLITFITTFADEEEFEKAIEDDLGICIGKDDHLGDRDWPERSLVLTTEDFALFKKRLVYASILIEKDE